MAKETRRMVHGVCTKKRALDRSRAMSATCWYKAVAAPACNPTVYKTMIYVQQVARFG